VWALTLRQPWAWMVIHGSKDLENRTWINKIVLELQRTGAEFAIHAGHSMTRVEYAEAVAFAKQEDPRLCVPRAEELQFGQVIGTARLSELVPVQHYGPPGRADHVRWHMEGQWGWRLSERRALPSPFRCAGKQGFWKLDDSLIENARKVA